MLTIVRTPERITAVFTESDKFAAMNAAEAWCQENGLSVGRMERGKPRGLLYGEFDIAKWHNLRKHEVAALHGRMTGDMMYGPVQIDVIAPPEQLAKEEAHALES